MYKGTVKSCSCTQCRRGKASKFGQCLMKSEERAARHAVKVALKKNPEEAVITPAHRGSYTD
jgi:predicted metal-binding protein